MRICHSRGGREGEEGKEKGGGGRSGRIEGEGVEGFLALVLLRRMAALLPSFPMRLWLLSSL